VRIRIHADLHVGSKWGLWPPGVTDDDGQAYPQSAAQELLWHWWLRIAQEAPRPDLVVLNGDLLDGPGWRGAPGDLLTGSMDLQQRALVEVLRPVVRPGTWYCVAGTQYHEPDRLGVVAEALGAAPGPNGERVLDHLWLECRGLRILCMHHPDGRGWYQGTGMDRDAMLAVLQASLGRMPLPDVIVESHLHMHAYAYVHRRLVVRTPGWQLQTRYARARAPFRWLPDIGCVDIVLRDGEPPVVEPYLFQLPLPEPQRIVEEVRNAKGATGRAAAARSARGRRGHGSPGRADSD
jgi:hypothetical protein